MAVLAGVHLAADVNPFGGAFGFETELVEGDVVDEPVEGICKFRQHMQLSAILRESVLERELAPKQHTINQQQFQKMLQMRHNLPGIGRVKLMVGVKRSDKMKVQYCITAIEPVIIKAKQPR